MKKNSGKFNPKGLKEVLARLEELKKLNVVVGIPASANGERKDGVSNATIAAAHEFGVPEQNIPERSHYRSTLGEKKGEYSSKMSEQSKKVLAGTEQPEAAFEKLGIQYSNDVKKKIQAGIAPALDPKTIKRKGSSKALIDTGQYVQSITYEVRRD